MKKYFVPGLLAVGLAASALMVNGHAQTNSNLTLGKRCNLVFEAMVHQGPDKGLSLAGKLEFKMDTDGTVTGSVRPKQGAALNMTGQINGRMVAMAFDLGKKGIVYGTGLLLESVKKGRCGRAAGGTFAGPKPGDLGDWEGCFPGSVDANNITQDTTGAYNTKKPIYTPAPVCIPSFYYNQLALGK